MAVEPSTMVGGLFKRFIVLIKGAMYKTISKNSLAWYDLEEVLMKV